MSAADTYRKMAAELRAKALTTPTNESATHLDSLAKCYLRLAEQAEQNRLSDVWAEFGQKPRLDEGEAA
jgi:predicted component of type VI protein secretion system